MQIALIAEHQAWLPWTSLGDLDFALTQLALSGAPGNWSEAYIEFYRHRAPGRYLILDNGAWEGELISVADVIDVARRMRADEIILPDAIGDADCTIELAATAYEQARHRLPGVALQVVPHGRTIGEYVDCLKGLMERVSFDVVGISRADVELGLDLMSDRVARMWPGPMRYLGWARQDPRAVTRAAQSWISDRVLSVDSARPIRWAACSARLPRRPDPADLDVYRRSDIRDLTKTSAGLTDSTALGWNIAVFREHTRRGQLDVAPPPL